MLEGAMEPKTIASRAAMLGFPAVALTDRNGLYGAMPFSDACTAKGVQPIIGATLAVARPSEIGGEERIDWLVLLAKDDQGYANLSKLVSTAHLDRPLELVPHVEFATLEGLSGGLIALTAGGEGALTGLLSEGQQAKADPLGDQLAHAIQPASLPSVPRHLPGRGAGKSTMGNDCPCRQGRASGGQRAGALWNGTLAGGWISSLGS